MLHLIKEFFHQKSPLVLWVVDEYGPEIQHVFQSCLTLIKTHATISRASPDGGFHMDLVFLARLQFAVTVGFHFLFPPISIGLAWILVFVEAVGWRTGSETWQSIGKLFSKLLALTFAVGVASGIVMEFQFGTNWASYSRFVGDIFGAPLAAEAIFAFFLESTFLGVYLLGRNRVSKEVHWFSILVVAIGTTLSAFWILVANSWQQTPAGFEVINGRAVLTSFTEAVFNSSMWPRFFHQMTAAMITGAFFMAAAAAWLLLKNKGKEVALLALKVSLVTGFIFAIISIFPTGHWHASQVARDQPAKFAVIEGLYETQTKAPLAVFGIPTVDKETEKPRLAAEIRIPGMASWLATGDVNAEIKGTDAFPASDLPPFGLPFFSFHLMVALGVAFLGLTALGLLFWKLNLLERARWFLVLMVIAGPLPLIANQLGWITAEVGRQPWTVYNYLRTADSVSITVGGGELVFSLVMLSSIYALLLFVYLFVLGRILSKGPEVPQTAEVVS
jgi:cytochrome d ubiquinol oxidase subunit I